MATLASNFKVGEQAHFIPQVAMHPVSRKKKPFLKTPKKLRSLLSQFYLGKGGREGEKEKWFFFVFLAGFFFPGKGKPFFSTTEEEERENPNHSSAAAVVFSLHFLRFFPPSSVEERWIPDIYFCGIGAIPFEELLGRGRGVSILLQK